MCILSVPWHNNTLMLAIGSFVPLKNTSESLGN